MKGQSASVTQDISASKLNLVAGGISRRANAKQATELRTVINIAAQAISQRLLSRAANL
jgi:hypothetical protein